MKLCFIATREEDRQIFFKMLRTNLEHNFGLNYDYKSTIGVNICVKHLYDETSRQKNKKIAKLIIWDSSPSDLFKWVRQLFYNGAIGVILLHSGTSQEEFAFTHSLLPEFEKFDGPKYLINLVETDWIHEYGNESLTEMAEYQGNLMKLSNSATEMGFNVEYIEKNPVKQQIPPKSYEEFTGYWRELRKFYETIIIDIFSHAVKNIPGNTFDVERFKDSYFSHIDKFDKSLRNIYRYLDELGLNHDKERIYVNLKEGTFSINIFTSACFYHYPNSEKTKYICMVPKDNQFIGWSNINYLPRNFILSIAKAFHLKFGTYDGVLRGQLDNLKK